jgi:hypothetical protein
MTKNYQDSMHRKIFLASISATILVGSFVIGIQLVQPSMAPRETRWSAHRQKSDR